MKKLINCINLLIISILAWPLASQEIQELYGNQLIKPQAPINKSDENQQNPQGKPNRKPLIEYIPPPLDKPQPIARVVPGGTRSAKLLQPVHLTLITPNHRAHTQMPQPTLYWYLSKSTDLPVVFTLIEINAIKPLLEKKLPSPLTSGFHSVSIAHYGVQLAPEKTYEWSISILQDTVQERPSSGDIIAKAFIMRIKKNPDGPNDNLQLDSISRAKSYAEQGFWYDSLESLMETDSTGTNQQAALNTRSNLLEQVGLTNFK